MFEDFSQQHLATASIGQVHEAHLITGERVAVKVQKEGITDKIDLDIRIMKYIANRADKLKANLRKLNLPGIMDEFDLIIGYGGIIILQVGQFVCNFFTDNIWPCA